MSHCVATETDILLLSDDLRDLVDAAEERGSLLQSELNEVLEPLGLDPLEQDAIVRELETRSIDVVNDVEDGDEPAPAPPLQLSWETTTDALQLFLREAGRHPLLTAAQEVSLAKRIEQGDLLCKQRMIQSNLRLVVSIAKRHVGPSNNFFELVSDGNMSLIRAVEKFDFSRGNKFSTYASWAIMKNFARTIPEENYRRDRFVTGHEEMFEAAADNRIDEHEYESAQKRMEEAVKGMLGRLDDRERRIIISRYGIAGASERTLEQLGRELGITKERVRQIESRGVDKLRKIAGEQKLELPML